MASKEIWISCYHFHPVWSGPAERFVRYARYFKDRDLDPVFLTIFREQGVREKNGFPVRFIGEKEVSISTYFKMLSQKALAEKPKGLIVLLADWKNAGDIQRLRKEGVPVIYVNTMVQKFSNSTNPIKRWLSNFLNKRYLNAYSHVVCSSPALEAALVSFGVPEEKIAIIPNGVDLDRFKSIPEPKQDRLKQALNLPLDRTLVLFVGLMVERKGVLELLQGWKQYKQNGGEGALILVGDEQRANQNFQSFYEQWDEVLATIRPEDEVFRFPPSEQIENYFQVADLFVFLSKKEGMPNVIGEAMASGLPVLLTPFEGFSNAWGDKNEHFWLIPERSASTIANMLKMILSDKPKRDAIGENGRQHIIEHQDVRKSVNQYIDLIECVG